MENYPDCSTCGVQHEPGELCGDTGKRLLVVEDNRALASVLARTLENAGYKVVTASSAREAIERFQSKEPFDLLITDLVMPGDQQGDTLARILRKSAPVLPVIFITGYTTELISRRTNDLRQCASLQKTGPSH